MSPSISYPYGETYGGQLTDYRHQMNNWVLYILFPCCYIVCHMSWVSGLGDPVNIVPRFTFKIVQFLFALVLHGWTEFIVFKKSATASPWNEIKASLDSIWQPLNVSAKKEKKKHSQWQCPTHPTFEKIWTIWIGVKTYFILTAVIDPGKRPSRK